MNTTTINVHQTLHGYENGHRLLHASRELASDVQREMLSLSDLALTPTAGFDPYLTAYPLPDLGLYAWSRTWIAKEMKRPGCVWTHTLLIEFTDLVLLDRMSQLQHLFKLFERPAIKEGAIENENHYMTSTAWEFVRLSNRNATPTSSKVASSNLERDLLAGLYGHPASPVFLLSPDAMAYEPLVLSVWLQQWPRLRRQFAFCTGTASNRKRNGQAFDLQVAPISAASTLKRDAPSAIILREADLASMNSVRVSDETFELEEDEKDMSWLAVAVADLGSADGNQSSLREFFRHYGADATAGRAQFSVLGNVFAWVEKVNVSQEPAHELPHLFESVAEAFPRAKQAVSLKTNLFGRPGPNELLKVADVELLHALAVTPYYRAFDISSLNVPSRVEALWRQKREDAETLLLELVKHGKNPVVEDIVSTVARAVTPEEALSLLRRSPSLGAVFIQRNRTLVNSSAIWRGSVDLQRELFDVLASSNLTDEEKLYVTTAVFNANANALAVELNRRYGAIAAQGVLAELEVLPRGMTDDWHHLLADHQEILTGWLSNQVRSPQLSDLNAIEVIAPLLCLVQPTSPKFGEVSSSEWTGFVDKVMSTNVLERKARRLQIDACAFVLAVGLMRSDAETSLMVARTFQPMHDALAQEQQSFHAWKWLEPLVPSLGYMNWDKCERLRLAIIERWAKNNWPVEQLIGGIEDFTTLQSIILACQRTPQGEAFFKIVRKNVSEGLLSVPPWQRPLWKKKKKFFHALLDHFLD